MLVSYLKVFGCSTFIHVYPQERSKLGPMSIKCAFIGYSANKKKYKCYCPTTRTTFETMDVTFLESNPYFSKTKIQGEIITRFQTGNLNSMLEVEPDQIQSYLIPIKSQPTPTNQSISPMEEPHYKPDLLPTHPNQIQPTIQTNKQVYFSKRRKNQQETETQQ